MDCPKMFMRSRPRAWLLKVYYFIVICVSSCWCYRFNTPIYMWQSLWKLQFSGFLLSFLDFYLVFALNMDCVNFILLTWRTARTRIFLKSRNQVANFWGFIVLQMHQIVLTTTTTTATLYNKSKTCSSTEKQPQISPRIYSLSGYMLLGCVRIPIAIHLSE